MKHGARNIQSGFTLIEVVVVLFVFMAIISTTVSIFISIVQQQREMLAQQEMLNQVSYAQEYISRAARAAVVDFSGECLIDDQDVSYPGSVYLLTRRNDDLGAYQGMKFVTKDNICQEFFFDIQEGVLKEIKGAGLAQPIMSGKFTVPFAAFVINGDGQILVASQGDALQPRVTFLLQIQKSGATQQTLPHVFQTTISQRNLNLLE